MSVATLVGMPTEYLTSEPKTVCDSGIFEPNQPVIVVFLHDDRLKPEQNRKILSIADAINLRDDLNKILDTI